MDDERCRCGRVVRPLNAASDDAKCPDCGYVPELCPCAADDERSEIGKTVFPNTEMPGGADG